MGEVRRGPPFPKSPRLMPVNIISFAPTAVIAFTFSITLFISSLLLLPRALTLVTLEKDTQVAKNTAKTFLIL